MNFSDYLIYVKSQLTNIEQFRLIYIVLGNESCDLDSTISACVYAYFLHLICTKKNEILYLPIVNNNESIFRLRSEIRWFLKENFSNVIFISNVNFDELYSQNKLRLILVDHHYLRSKFNDLVVEIIDHHQIKQDAIRLQDSSAIQIEPVGSCCTLIAEKIFSSNFRMTEEIAYLLIGPIVFDTVNFSPSVGKTTEKDREIFTRLQKCLQTPIDSKKLFSDLKESSCDATGYSIQDLLQKDAKQILTSNFRLIMSSLPTNYSVEKFIGKLKNIDELNEFLAKNDNADGVIFTSIETNENQSKRQLGFYMKNLVHSQIFNEYLQTADLQLDLHERTISNCQLPMKFFDQNNVRLSRKQILPLIEKFLQNKNLSV